jgi:hypothetical protein
MTHTPLKSGPAVALFSFAALILFVPSFTRAQIPALPRVPDGMPPEIQQALQPRLAPLQTRIDKLISDGKNLNAHCAHFEVGSALEQECNTLKQTWIGDRASVQKDANNLQARITLIAQLVAQDQQLTQAINNNLQRIEELGFKHRAEDFEEWDKLSDEAKKEFVDKVKEQAVDLLTDKVQDGILSGVKGISQEKADKWIAFLEKGDPKPVTIIAAVQRMVTSESREHLAADANMLSTFLKTAYQGWNAQTREELLNLALDNVCEGVPSEALSAQCKLFRSEARVLSAEVYYGAATYVARTQVDTLTNLSEDQLKALAARNKVLKEQIHDRSEVRSRLKLLLTE